MLKALELTLKNLDVIAPAIGVSRAQLNHYYETNTHTGKAEYALVKFGPGILPNAEFVDVVDFNFMYRFVSPENPEQFTEVTPI